MRLIRSDSPEVARCLESRNCVWARLSLPQRWVAGNVGIVLLMAIVAVLSWTIPLKPTGALLMIWNAFFLWRAGSSLRHRRHWIMAVCAEGLYFRLFSHRGPRSGRGDDPDVLVLNAGEVASLSIKTLEVFWSGPKPRIGEWLIVEPQPETRATINDQFARSSPPKIGCDLYMEWYTGSKDGNLNVPWRGYRPSLRLFLKEIASQFPSLTTGAETRSELDLMGLYRKPELERRKLLAQAKRLGCGADCLLVLTRNPRRRMSMAEAQEYMSSIDIGAEEPEHTAP